jgi:hypothetical protein
MQTKFGHLQLHNIEQEIKKAFKSLPDAEKKVS